VALQPHPFNRFVELAKVRAHRQARLPRLLPVSRRDVDDELFVPAQEGVAHQAGDVVADRTVDRILKVQHAQTLRAEHEVARHEVAVHIHPRRAERAQVVRLDRSQGASQRVLLFGAELEAAVRLDVPLVKQRELAREQSIIVGRQHVGPGGQLPAHQGVNGAHVEIMRWLAAQGRCRWGAMGGDDLHQRLRAQIGQQHKALWLVPGQHFGREYPRLPHQVRHLNKGPAVFFFGRRVHDDAAGAVEALYP
jgi:hypothetical protein